MKLFKFKIIKDYVRQATKILKTFFPHINTLEIENFVEKEVKQNCKDEKIKLFNNYTNTEYSSSVLNISEFYYKSKPLVTEHGVLFNDKIYNPIAKTLEILGKTRKIFKNKMYEYEEGSFWFNMYNLKQLNQKVKMNACYGVLGAKSSMLYNIYCALSITGKGQTLISTALMTFEAFMSNNVLFETIDDCFVFMKNVLSEYDDREFSSSQFVDKDFYVSDEICLQKLINTFEKKPNKEEIKILKEFLFSLKREDKVRIYFKNNLYGFSNNRRVKQLWRNVILGTKIFNNPNKVPIEIKDDLEYLWKALKEFVFYNYPTMDRIRRLKTKKRDTVIVIDTDSNMLNLHPWVEYCLEEILTPEEIQKESNFNNLRHKLIYSQCYVLTEVISEALEKFLKYGNVPKERRGILTMKNEYLFLRMVIANTKKTYASIIEYKEGNDMHNKLDVKGLAITKSSSNRNSSAVFKSILENDILKSRKIDLSVILKKLYDFEQELRKSVERRELTYLLPSKINAIESYKEPFQEQAVLASIAWNATDEDNQIKTSDSFYKVNVKGMLKKEELGWLQENYPDIYKKLCKEIYESGVPELEKKGISVIGIPRGTSAIPEWIYHYLDLEALVQKTMVLFVPVTNTINLKKIYNSSNTFNFGTVIDI